MDSGIYTPLDPFHCLIYCKLSFQYLKETTFEREVWNYNRCDFNLLNNALMNAPWNVLDIYEDIDDALHYFMKLFNDIVKEHVPNYTVKISPKDKPFITTAVKKALLKN